jgi:hypothetical protein
LSAFGDAGDHRLGARQNLRFDGDQFSAAVCAMT